MAKTAMPFPVIRWCRQGLGASDESIPSASVNYSVSEIRLGRSDKMGSISTRMTERFGCRHPFASAGLAFAGGTADLALAGCGKSRSVVLPAHFVAFCPVVIG